jgi:hypothetical protein
MAKRKGNDVFQGSEGESQSAGWQGQASNVLKEDFDMEIPVETVPLPSRGVVYPEDHPLFGKETLDIKAMTAREEDILTNRVYIKKKTVISELLRSCFINKDIDPDSLIAGDRNAIMVALRVTGYGAEYKVEVDCPSCSERSKQEFNLASLPIRRLSQQPIANGSNLFEFKLPVSKKKVRFKYLTGLDEMDMAVAQDRLKKRGFEAGNMVTRRFANQVVGVDKVNDRNKIQRFCQNMPARDSLSLRKYIDKNEPGIDMKSYMTCPHCLEESEVRLPMGASFFWPDE